MEKEKDVYITTFVHIKRDDGQDGTTNVLTTKEIAVGSTTFGKITEEIKKVSIEGQNDVMAKIAVGNRLTRANTG